MHTDFLPTRKIPVSQLYAWNSQRAFPLEIELSHRGLPYSRPGKRHGLSGINR